MSLRQLEESLQVVLVALLLGAGITGFIQVLDGQSVSVPGSVCIVVMLLILAAIVHDELVLYLLIRKPDVDKLFIITEVRVNEALRFIPLLLFLTFATPAYWLRGKMGIHENLW